MIERFGCWYTWSTAAQAHDLHGWDVLPTRLGAIDRCGRDVAAGALLHRSPRAPGPAAGHDRLMGRGAVVPRVPVSEFAGFRFPPEVIVLAVRWSVRCALS